MSLEYAKEHEVKLKEAKVSGQIGRIGRIGHLEFIAQYYRDLPHPLPL